VRIGLELDTKLVVHAPALGDCAVCHAPHATENPSLLIAGTAELCTQCHQDIAHTVASATTQHAAVTSKRACTNCHAPHASNFASLLKAEPQNLCFECHNQTIKMPDGTSLANMKSLIETGKSLHGALTQRGCVECHEIHGGGHRRLLTNEYPSDLYYPFSESTYALCFSCHDRQLVLEAKTGSATGFRNGDTNLHFVHVNRDKKGRTCAVCHDAHAADHDKHIRDTVPFGPGGWKLPIRYEALPEGGKCGGTCHTALEYNRTKPITYAPKPAESAWKGEGLIPGSRAEPPSTANPSPK
jgi:predicted CXXCH cytochrome family protein